MRIYGYVTDSENVGIEFANVYLQGTTTGATTNKNGYYDLSFSCADTVTLVFSMVGYQTLQQRFLPHKDITNINVQLPTDAEALAEIEVRGLRRTGAMDQVEALTARSMPDATGGGIESLLITFAGVAQNNELSSQYNVRGGSFDENSLYVNGIEIHKPLLIRQGQQEGLSFVNPEMTDNVAFSAGGFEARYGDKMSSVLDITYKRPEALEASLSASLMGANAYVGFGNKRHSQMHSIRYKTSRYMLWSTGVEGSYNPNFADYQTQMTWKASDKWDVLLMANLSCNSYVFQPDSQVTSNGGLNAVECRRVFKGQEKDLFYTAFAALQASFHPNRQLTFDWTISGNYTNEQENYDIRGDYALAYKSISQTTDLSGATTGTISATGNADSEADKQASLLGTGSYHEHARNMLQSGILTAQHDGTWRHGQNNLSWGISLQGELIQDHISEWQWQDSMGYSMPTDSKEMQLYYAMKGDNRMQSLRTQAYLQDTYRWNTARGDLLLTGGLRFHYWSYNHEPLISPRVQLMYQPGWKRDITFRFATGLYYQAPFYKELRALHTDESGISRIVLNNHLKAQRSVHAVLGMDYYFRAWGRPFKLTAEAYGKYIDRMVSYTVDNVRVRYSGDNDARGFAAGLDLKLYGELVPGADSWISFSTMCSREQLLEHPEYGWQHGSNEQRYALTVFFQDYLPRWPQYRAHIKLVFADGLPFSTPRNLEFRNALRTPNYKRFDIGISRVFNRNRDKWMARVQHLDAWWIQLEVLNVIGTRNVNSYFWVATFDNQMWPSPNYLTGRRFNLKLTFDIK